MDAILSTAVLLKPHASAYTLRAPHANHHRVRQYMDALTVLLRQQDTLFFLRKRGTHLANKNQKHAFIRSRTDGLWGNGDMYVVKSPVFRTVSIVCGDRQTVTRAGWLWRLGDVQLATDEGAPLQHIPIHELWTGWAVDVGMRFPKNVSHDYLKLFLSYLKTWQVGDRNAAIQTLQVGDGHDVTPLIRVYYRNRFMIALVNLMSEHQTTPISLEDSNSIVRRKLLTRHRQVSGPCA